MSREMKDSGVEWIGEIPEDWDIQRGKFIFTKLSRSVQDNDEVITCFRDGEVTLRKNRREEGFTFSDKEIGYQGIEPGDLVVHGMDGFAGSIGISDSRGKATPVLNVLDTKYSKLYYMYYLRSVAYGDVFTAIATGIRVRSCNLNWNKLGELSYPVPRANEQKDIANYIKTKCTAIDTAIEKTKKSIEKLEEYKKAVVTKAVTKGIDPDAKMKDSGVEWIGEIPEGWKVSKFKFHAKAKSEKNPGNATILSLYREYGIVIKDSRDDNHNRTSLDTSLYRYVEVNDFVVNKMKAWQGSVAVSEYTGVVSPAYYVYKITDAEIYPLYLHYLLRSCYKDEFRRLSGGIRIGQWDLPSDALENTLIIQPSYTEQVRITEYIQKHTTVVEQLIEKKKKAIEKWEEYKKSLIYYTVTGKIDCRGENL